MIQTAVSEAGLGHREQYLGGKMRQARHAYYRHTFFFAIFQPQVGVLTSKYSNFCSCSFSSFCFRPEREDIHLFLGKVETKAEKAREDFEKRWNFSLVEDKPIEGRIQWETLKARKNQGSPTSTSNSAGAGQTRTAER